MYGSIIFFFQKGQYALLCLWHVQSQIGRLHQALFPKGPGSMADRGQEDWGKAVFFRYAWPLCAWTLSSCGFLYKTCIKSSQSVNIPAWMGKVLKIPKPSSETIDSWWLLGEGEPVFFKGVALPAKPAELLWMVPHPGVYRSYKLESGHYLRGKKGHKVKRRGSGDIGYRCRRSGDGIIRKLIKI